MDGGGQPLNGLDFDVDAARQVESHQAIDRLVRRLIDVDESVVDAKLEVLHRLFVDVGAANDAKSSDSGWKGDRACDLRAGSLGSIGDLRSRLIQNAVIVGAQSDSDADIS